MIEFTKIINNYIKKNKEMEDDFADYLLSLKNISDGSYEDCHNLMFDRIKGYIVENMPYIENEMYMSLLIEALSHIDYEVIAQEYIDMLDD